MFQGLRKKLIQKKKPSKKVREVVIVFPFNTKTRELFIIEEYIHHYKQSFWKFVSGGIDKEGKDIITHAKEELAEEVALESDNFSHFYSTPKIFGMRGTHFYIAEDPRVMEKPPENPDTDEIIGSKWVNEEVFKKMLKNRELLWDEATMCASQVFEKYK